MARPPWCWPSSRTPPLTSAAAHPRARPRRRRRVLKARWDDRGSRPVYRGELEGNDGLGFPAGLHGRRSVDGRPTPLAAEALTQVRGTVQADILKEGRRRTRASSPSSRFGSWAMSKPTSLTGGPELLLGLHQRVPHRRSGRQPHHTAGPHPANGFTYVEYYLSRGMDINALGPNLSFFFSNGIDPEYAVIGRVARRIWAKAMDRSTAPTSAPKLKYHPNQWPVPARPGNRLQRHPHHAVQALYAIYDNCNSLHTPLTRPSPPRPSQCAPGHRHPAHHQPGVGPRQE